MVIISKRGVENDQRFLQKSIIKIIQMGWSSQDLKKIQMGYPDQLFLKCACAKFIWRLTIVFWAPKQKIKQLFYKSPWKFDTFLLIILKIEKISFQSHFRISTLFVFNMRLYSKKCGTHFMQSSDYIYIFNCTSISYCKSIHSSFRSFEQRQTRPFGWQI